MDLLNFLDGLLEDAGVSFDDVEQNDLWNDFLLSRMHSARYQGFKYKDPGPCEGGRDLVISPSGRITSLMFFRVFPK